MFSSKCSVVVMNSNLHFCRRYVEGCLKPNPRNSHQRQENAISFFDRDLASCVGLSALALPLHCWLQMHCSCASCINEQQHIEAENKECEKHKQTHTHIKQTAPRANLHAFNVIFNVRTRTRFMPAACSAVQPHAHTDINYLKSQSQAAKPKPENKNPKIDI